MRACMFLDTLQGFTFGIGIDDRVFPNTPPLLINLRESECFCMEESITATIERQGYAIARIYDGYYIWA